MAERKTIERARKDKREGKSASTQASECVREEIDHIREGKHGARSTKQAIAIGLSKARRAGVKLPPPGRDQASPGTRKRAEADYRAGQSHPGQKPSRTRSRADEGTEARVAPRRIARGPVVSGARCGQTSPEAATVVNCLPGARLPPGSAAERLSRVGRQLFVDVSSLLQVFLFELFEIEQFVLRALNRTDDLVELDLHGFGVPATEPFRSASGVRCSTAPYLLADCRAIRRSTDH